MDAQEEQLQQRRRAALNLCCFGPHRLGLYKTWHWMCNDLYLPLWPPCPTMPMQDAAATVRSINTVPWLTSVSWMCWRVTSFILVFSGTKCYMWNLFKQEQWRDTAAQVTGQVLCDDRCVEWTVLLRYWRRLRYEKMRPEHQCGRLQAHRWHSSESRIDYKATFLNILKIGHPNHYTAHVHSTPLETEAWVSPAQKLEWLFK